MELWYANTVITVGQVPSANQRRPSSAVWMSSPSARRRRRRAGIELRRNGVDADVVAAGEMVGKYQRSSKSV